MYFHEVEMMSYPLFEHQPYDLALATKMATVARAEKLDLLHVHYAIPHSISAILARESIKQKRYVPVITTLHGTDITLVGADRSYLPITRYGLQQSDGVTAVSKFLQKATIETFDFDDVEVIPNFICSCHYKRLEDFPLRNELAPNGEMLLTHVSNFRPVKRPADCVEIFAKVKKRHPKTRLVMVGDGPERGAVIYLAEKLGVSQDVLFVGKQGKIADYLGVSDVFLLPSELESFGLAALEALACEVPVIATRIGGVPEVVTDGETGYLSDVGDTDKMAEDTFELLENEGLRRAFGQKGRETAVQRYGSDKIVPQYIEFYERTLNKARAEHPLPVLTAGGGNGES
jgi:L-malate glycosyltransferase